MRNSTMWNYYCLNQILQGVDPTDLDSNVEGGMSSEELIELSRRIKKIPDIKFDDLDKTFMNTLRVGDYSVVRFQDNSISMDEIATFCRTEKREAGPMAGYALGLFSDIVKTKHAKPYVEDGILYVPEKYLETKMENKMCDVFCYFVWGFDEKEVVKRHGNAGLKKAMETVSTIASLCNNLGEVSLTSKTLFSLLSNCLKYGINPASLSSTCLKVHDLNPIYKRTGGLLWWGDPCRKTVNLAVPRSSKNSVIVCKIDYTTFMTMCKMDISAPSRFIMKGEKLLVGEKS